MARISQKVDLSPVVNEVNDNQLDISTEHQLTRDNLTAAKTSLETGQSEARAAIEGGVQSEAAATRTAVNSARDSVNANVDSEAASTRTTVNNARDNVKAEIVRQTAGSLYALLTSVINAARDNVKSLVTTRQGETESHITAEHNATQTTVNSARDSVNSNVDAEANSVRNTVNAARDNVKSHVTAAKQLKKFVSQKFSSSSRPDFDKSRVTLPQSYNVANSEIRVDGMISGVGSATYREVYSAYFINTSTIEIMHYSIDTADVTEVCLTVKEWAL